MAKHHDTTRNTNRSELRPHIHFFGFRTFAPLVSPSPFPDTQSFGGFATPGIGWRSAYRGAEKGHRAQWAAAETGGIQRNNDKRALRPKIQFFAFLHFRSSRFLLPSSLPQYTTFGGFATPGIGRRAEYKGEEKRQRPQRASAEPGGPPRNTNRRALRPQIHFFWRIFAFDPLVSPCHTHFPKPNVSAVSKRLVLVGGWNIG